MINGKLRTLCLKLAVPAFALAMVLPAHGDMVTYSTTGAFSASGGGSSATFTLGSNNATLTFSGVNNAQLNANPTSFTSAGIIQVQTVSTSGVNIGGTFTLGVQQTQPSVNNGSLNGDLSGAVSFNSSTGTLDFTSTSLTLGTVTYTLLTPDLNLVPPSTLNGMTSIELQLAVTQNGGGGGNNPTPEPSFFVLTFAGFAAMGMVVFRRYRKTV